MKTVNTVFPQGFRGFSLTRKSRNQNFTKLLKFSKIFLTTAILLILLISNLHAQKHRIKFEHLTVEDGLSQATITCIVQDNQGFLWFGTEDGLNKYDGYQFTVYKPETENPQSLSSNVITAIEIDPSGVLWIGTQHGGLNRFDPATETFEPYQHDPQNLNSLSHDYIFSIHADRSGTLWIGTDNGLNQFDPETETFIQYIHNADDPDSLSRFHDPNQVRAIYEDQSGVLWIGTSGDGLKQFNRATKTFRDYPRENNYPTFALQNWIRSISQESPTSLWLGTGKGLMRFDKNTGSLTQYTHDPAGSKTLGMGLIGTIYEDRSGVQWFGTVGTGLNRLQSSTGRFERYQFDPKKPNSISNNDVYSIFEDRSGMLWVGTLSGLNRFALAAKPFQHYQHDENNPNSISSNVVWAFYEDQSEMLWIGTDNGGSPG